MNVGLWSSHNTNQQTNAGQTMLLFLEAVHERRAASPRQLKAVTVQQTCFNRKRAQTGVIWTWIIQQFVSSCDIETISLRSKKYATTRTPWRSEGHVFCFILFTQKNTEMVKWWTVFHHFLFMMLKVIMSSHMGWTVAIWSIDRSRWSITGFKCSVARSVLCLSRSRSPLWSNRSVNWSMTTADGHIPHERALLWVSPSSPCSPRSR